MCDAVVWWDASGCFSQGIFPGEFLREEPHSPHPRLGGLVASDEKRPGDILSIPFLDDGVSYLIQIIRKLPGYLKGVGPADFTHLIFGPWEVGRYRTCFIGPYSYLFRILDVYDEEEDDEDGSDSDDSDFLNGTPQSDGTVSTLPVYTLDDGSPSPAPHSPVSTFLSYKSQSPTYNLPYPWHDDDTDSGSESPTRGRSRTRGVYPGRFRLESDPRPVRRCSPLLLNRSSHEGLLFTGSFGVVSEPRIEDSPDVLRNLGSLMAIVDLLGPTDVPAEVAGRTVLSPLTDIHTTVQLPENSVRVVSHSTSQRPVPTQDPIGTPRRAGFNPLLGTQACYGSPLSSPNSADPSRSAAPQTRAIPRSSASDRTRHTMLSGSPRVGGNPYDRIYTADLVSDEEEYALRNSSGRIHRSSPQDPTRPPGLPSHTVNYPTRGRWIPPPRTGGFVAQIDLIAQKKRLALRPNAKVNEPFRATTNLCPRSPGFPRSPIPQQIPSSSFIKSPRPRVPAVGKSSIVQFLEDLVESEGNSDEGDADFYSHSPKTRFARDFPANEPDVEKYHYVGEDPSPGLDRFLAERRRMSPEPVLALKQYTPHDSEPHPCDKDKVGARQLDSDSDSDDSDDGVFDDFPVCEMSIAMGLHSRSRRRGNTLIH